MRVVLLGIFVALGAVYSSGALYFWRHERSSQSLEAARSLPPSELEHPEATLALIRDAMEERDFSPRVGELVERSREQVPSFYQPPAYQATYYAARLEEPARTREGYEAALARFPANGRLHLDYARWLLMAPSVLPGVVEARDAAEEQIRLALGLEPDLTPDALETLGRYGVPSEHWPDIVPDTIDARRLMVSALARAGHRDEALSYLRPLLARTEEVRHQRQAAYWALSWGDPELALEAVKLWQANRDRTGFEPQEPGLLAARAHLRLGEMDAAYDVFRSTLNDVGPSSSAGLKLLCGMGEEYRRLLLGLARLHRQQGNDRQAITYYRKILRVEPENAAATNELMSVLARPGH
jgi:tetratricopeptide (TPR) repeat protein